MATFLKVIIPAIIIPLILSGCGTKGAEPGRTETPVKVSTREARPNGRPEVFSYSGTIAADNTVSLGFSVAGRITAMLVEEGQRVSMGQLLATVETSEYENAMLIANASWEQAADNYKRLEQLHSKGSLPERDFIAARSALAGAEASKNVSAKRVADTRLYAPFTGIISAKILEKGATAAPGVPVLTILKTDNVYAQAPVGETEIGKLTVGKEATVSIPVLHEEWKGKISIINPQADVTTKTFTVKIRLSNTGGKLLPGMMATIKIATGAAVDVLTIPAESVVRDADELTYVFVVNDRQKAIRRRVAIGGLSDNEVIVTSGLQAGDKVVIAGQTRLKDGQTVTIQ